MKKMLNTLYITSEGAYLSRNGDAIDVKIENETKFHIPIHNLESIICFGPSLCTPAVLGFCGENNVTVTFLSRNGRFWGSFHGPVSGNVLLRKEQYRRSMIKSETAKIARHCVLGKCANARTVILRAAREHSDSSSIANLKAASEKILRISRKLEGEENLDNIRGQEGMAANLYFGVLNEMILHQKKAFHFDFRNRRPPLDNINALLSFLYAILVHDVRSALESVGLDPAVGFLHADRPGRPALALDIMEELRPLLADRLAISMINRKQIKGADFIKTESGAIRIKDKKRKDILVAYQQRKKEQIMHPFLNEKINIGLIPFAQALLLARHLRGDIDGYPPFIWK